MKIPIAIAFSLSLFTISMTVFGTNDTGNLVRLVSTQHKNLFVFKVNKNWQGAKLEVIATNGECVSCQKLSKRKMTINFRDVKPGAYTIRVTKDDHTEEFQYIKN